MICAKENEAMSRMVTVLDRYRVNQPLVYTMDRIQDYLQAHFTADQTAVQLDPERYVCANGSPVTCMHWSIIGLVVKCSTS